MISPLFESLLRNSMTLLTDIDESESMVVHEGEMYDNAETSEEPRFHIGSQQDHFSVVFESVPEIVEQSGWPAFITIKLSMLNN